MYLAYFDESGDHGLINSPTKYFVLSCLLLEDSDWLNSLDQLVQLRRQLKITHGIPTRNELKAKHFKNGRGVFSGLGWSRTQRMALYRETLSYLSQTISARIFAVAIEKQPAAQKGWEPRLAAWTFILQRINRFCNPNDLAMIFPDEGHGYFIRRRIRHMRRYHQVPKHWGPGTIAFPIQRIIEDPNERVSQESYFIQICDLAAFAAHRSKYIDPGYGVPDDLWEELSDLLLTDVNKVRGGPPGIVKYP